MDIDPRQIEGVAVDIVDEQRQRILEPHAVTKHSTASLCQFDWCQNMSIDDFVQNEVPKLKSNKAAEGKYHRYVIRDLSHGRYYTVRPDGVLKIHITDWMDVNTNEFITEYNKGDEDEHIVETILNSPVPVFSYCMGASKACTLKLPPTTIIFRHIGNLGCKITLPPVLYRVYFAGSSISSSFVYVIKKDSSDHKQMVFGKLPLPNVYGDGKICTGNTRLDASDKVYNIFEAAYRSWQLFTGSLWNYDLLHDSYFPSNLTTIYNGLKDVPDNLKLSRGEDINVSCLKQLLAVLRMPDGYSKLDWQTCAPLL